MLRQKTGKGIALIAILSVIFAVLSGCSGEKNSESSETAWDKIKKKDVLVVGTAGTLYPTSYHDEKTNKLTGYDVEVMKEIAKRLGLDIKFKEIGFDGLFSSLNSSRIDVAANDIGITKERKKKLAFSDPYKYSFGSMVVRKKDHSGIHSFDDLKGKVAAGAANTIYTNIAKDFGAKTKIYGNVTNDVYFRDLSIGRTDVILNDYYLQKIALKYMPQFDLMIAPNLYYKPSQGGLAVKKGNDELVSQLNKALKDMKADGTLSKISKTFFAGMDVSKKPDVDIKPVKLDKKDK
ncbi:amino acid ABC transporter substrate-binding protein (PAAT family) [Scopulibacillus darangshiensis]|uniref:Amino acid ABC transporter substrate-binding protein (PAAT family) n=1 Tax=Scopulibacillus darangshiensis TaxID=442528 RepID=A0A4R2NY01_9BACL|nr:transporter substrate-binding domain-containing protein [Scopulibacillus darangshiensis]TCP27060.1 amino acid ABC transporter substrate-binding protein (PAAT family) [Scopulibacillus darangshiensis]